MFHYLIISITMPRYYLLILPYSAFIVGKNICKRFFVGEM